VHRIGLISDTNGLLRPEALAALGGVERIVHAGDVGRSEVLDALARIAPVVAVRGNVDHEPWARALPASTTIEIGGVRIHVLHVLDDLDLDPVQRSVGVVVYGHSHTPGIETRAGVLYVNPGSAGPRRFRLPTTVAELVIDAGRPVARIVPLLG
jgi:uncharacterized protein